MGTQRRLYSRDLRRRFNERLIAISVFPAVAGLKECVSLMPSTEDFAETDRRTLADISLSCAGTYVGAETY